MAYDRLHQSARGPADAVRITKNEDCIQTPSHHAAHSNVDPEGEQHSAEAVIETSQSVSKQSESTVVGFVTYSVIMRLENPPEFNACKKLHVNDKDLNKHIRTAHGEQNSDLHKCNENFKNNTNLQRHIHETHFNRAFYCMSCRAGFSTGRALVLRKKKQHKVVPKSFKRKKAAKKSCASTSEKKVLTYYACLLCDYSTTVKGIFERHVKGKHLNEKRFQCKRSSRQQRLFIARHVAGFSTQRTFITTYYTSLTKI